MPRITIRFALIALLLAAIVPTATGIGVSAYLNSRATVELLWHDLADEMIEDARQKALRYVESGRAQLRLSTLLTEQGVIDPSDRDALLHYLHRCLLAHPNVTWCSYGGTDGAYLAAYREPDGALRLTHREQEGGATRYRDYRIDPDGSYTLIHDKRGNFDPRKRPWWPIAQEATEPAWSEPFLFASRRQPGVVLVERQDKDGKMIGAWLMEYELSAIAAFLRGIKESAAVRGGPLSHTDIYIVSGEGKVIGHPEGQTAREGEGGPELVPAQEHQDEKLANAYAHAAGNGGGQRYFEVEAGGERYLAVSAPFAEDGRPDWIVLIAVPAEALLGRIYENNRMAAWIAAFAAFVSVLIGIVIAERTMGRALRGIASDLDQIGHLDFSGAGRSQHSSIREIAAMHAARDRMTGGLRSFAKYVPAGLVRDLMERGKEAALGGETRELTIYFADIADFTAIAEKLSPNDLVDQLGAYFAEMSGLIRAERGTVDKFIGDAIMAFWGAPQEVKDHALLACKAALRCQARLAELRQARTGEHRAEFHARIGINTGEVLVGNIGSEQRMNYTVMGDPVNVASRLEAQCKRAKVGIIIGQRTRELAGEAIVARPLDKLAVKGKEEGILVYELIALRAEAAPEQLRMEALGEEAMGAYLARDFDEVIVACRKLLKLLPGDVSASELLARAERLAKSGVPADWDGVMVLTDK